MGMGPSTSFDHNKSQDTISLNSRDIRNYKLTSMKQINRDKSGNSVFQLNDLKQNSTIQTDNASFISNNNNQA